MEEIFQRFAGAVAIGVEAAAALFIAIGALEALYSLARRYTPHARASVLSRKEIWVQFAMWLILALEFELAADVLDTAISPTWDDVGKLASIAAIRTVLNYFLEKDIDSFARASERPAPEGVSARAIIHDNER